MAIITILFLAISAAFSGSKKEPADAWHGYLIDLSCARERKDQEPDLGVKHSRSCLAMPVCDRSGFGLLTDGNEVLTFDEDGNRRMRTLLPNLKKESNLRATVHGARSGDVLQVRAIDLNRK